MQTNVKEKKISLTEDDLLVLSLIQKGHNIMAELFDMTRWDGGRLNRSIEKLDENHYIEREGLTGANFWTFELTPNGAEALPEMSAEEKRLASYGVSTTDVELLQACQKFGKGRATEIIVKMTSDETKKMAYAGSVVKLVRLGHLRESGFLKRIVEVNDSGTQLLKALS